MPTGVCTVERHLAGNKDRILNMNARARLPLVVEIDVGILRAGAASSQPANAAVAVKDVLAASAVVRAIAVADRGKS